MSCSLQSAWNKQHQPSTELNAHITGQAEGGTISTPIGELPNNSIDCFCHQRFSERSKTKRNHPFPVFS
jgi:hypothetical protein